VLHYLAALFGTAIHSAVQKHLVSFLQNVSEGANPVAIKQGL
jgi:hypothetical protein